MLKRRIITAFILIPITLLVLFFLPPPAFLLLTALIVLFAAWEWTALMEMKKPLPRFLYLSLFLILFIAILYLPMSIILFAALAWWLIATAIIYFYPSGTKWWRNQFCRGCMGIMVLMPCWAAINFIRNQNDNRLALLLFLFVLIWGADSAAYFAGKKWGKTLLAPQVSPGKTLAGVGGALLFFLIYTFAVFITCSVPYALWPWVLVLGFFTVIFSIIGDLFESVMKRQVGVKDSGQIFPGHGGLLDRIDSLTAAAPVFALGSMLVEMYLQS